MIIIHAGFQVKNDKENDFLNEVRLLSKLQEQRKAIFHMTC